MPQPPRTPAAVETEPRVILFAGPSLHGAGAASAVTSDIELHPPAARGDIDRVLCAPRPAGVIVLCDGVFQSVPAVSHAEIARAIDGGWRVWGVSSLGAIRAFEMRGEGMRGYGYVYEQFFRFDDFTDDEMCLLHFPAPSFHPLTEALVNVRYALARIGSQTGVTPEMQHRLIAELRSIWFGDRTVARMRSLMINRAQVPAPIADRFLARLPRHRVKSIDLMRLLTERPWNSSTESQTQADEPIQADTDPTRRQMGQPMASTS